MGRMMASKDTGEKTDGNERDLLQVLFTVYADLLVNQEDLESEFQQVLHKNLWDLYER